MTVLDNFEEWKQFLHTRVSQAKTLGMDQESLSDAAYQLGDYLAKDMDPKNVQERLLKDMWDVASEDEQRTVATLMVKMVDNGRQ